jgi:hypothetical protein
MEIEDRFDEIGLMDVADELSKIKNAAGFVADHVNDAQISANVWMIEERIGMVEQMVSYLMTKNEAAV